MRVIFEIRCYIKLFIERITTRKHGYIVRDITTFFHRVRKKRILSNPPHSTQIYQEALNIALADKDIKFISLIEYCLGQHNDYQGKRLLLRHDHDGGMKEPLTRLCDIEESLGLRSSVHILVDGDLYNPLPLVSYWIDLANRGFDVGLHTQSWMKINYKETFLDEIKKFEDLLGFSPKTFTHHGAWPRTNKDMLRRAEFIQNLDTLINGTTIVGYNNYFNWIVEDSAVKGEISPLTNPFLSINNYLYHGQVGLILTHDGYNGIPYWR